MSWYEVVPDKMSGGKLYSHKMLVDWLHQERPELSKSGYHWAIDKLIQKGELIRKGYDEYSIADDVTVHRNEYSPIYSDEAIALVDKLNKKYPYVPFTVFETVLMNSFLNHLIGQNTVFLQIERESSVYVFRYLQEEGLTNLLYKPNKKDFHLYWNAGTVVVTDLITEAPMRSDNPHSIMLEKMLVDMCADKLIASTFSKAELPDVFKQAYERYSLDSPRMMRYARRRNKEAMIKNLAGGWE